MSISPEESAAFVDPSHSAASCANTAPHNFDAWVEATCPPEALVLGVAGFTYADLHDPVRLASLTDVFHDELRQQAPDILAHLQALADGTLTSPEAVSEALVAIAPYVSAFIAKLFQIVSEQQQLQAALLFHDPLWIFKKEFCKKRLQKKNLPMNWTPDRARLLAHTALIALGANRDVIGTGANEEELAIAQAVLLLLEVDDTARKIAKAGGATWRDDLTAIGQRLSEALTPLSAAHRRLETAGLPSSEMTTEHAGELAALALDAIAADLTFRLQSNPGALAHWASLHEPRKLDYDHLVPLRRRTESPGSFVGLPQHRRERDGFRLTDTRLDTRHIQQEVDYCLYCHDRNKDSCAKGLHDQKTGATKRNPLGVVLNGCPLEEKISEMHLMRKEGDAIAALALICVDNPLCPGTGHRICNDCMKACVYQKQEPVNIPAIETATLTDVLSLPWGFEIYGLLTRWNPLNVKHPHPLPWRGRRALVVGLGPAGYTLVHHLARSGFAVAGVDGLKIEPLPVELTGTAHQPPHPIHDFSRLEQDLDERIVLGFGGVSEYGITARWDKNFLTALYITLARNPLVRFYGGVRFGGTLDLDDAWAHNFDHVALAAGAGRPTFVPMKNGFARGVRKASDFLMALQLTGASKPSSLANLQVRLPALVIGGGLTAIDTATELLAYYVIQVEKTARRYRTLVSELGPAAVDNHLDDEERAVVQEQCAHAEAIAHERKQAALENRAPRLQALLQQWGGVSLVYRKSLTDSPAYRLNHEEVEKSLEEGVVYFEQLSPVEAILDKNGAVCAVEFEKQALSPAGPWHSTGETVRMPAKTVCIAAGTSPNTTYVREHPHDLRLDARGQYFLPHTACRNEQGDVLMTPATHDSKQAFFTSYAHGEKTVSFYGDNHPYYAGSVVKAMASAKVGFERVVDLYPPLAVEPAPHDVARWFATLDNEWNATVHDVVRLGPTIVEVIVHAPAAARKFEPGQFYRLQNYESTAPILEGTRLAMEGLAMTGAWVDKDKGLLSTIVLEIGASSRLCSLLRKGERVVLMGPTGAPTEIPQGGTVLLCGGGLGNAVLFSIARACKAGGATVIYFAGYRNGADVFHRHEIEAATDQVIWCTDAGDFIAPNRPGDHHFRGNIVQAMVAYATGTLGQRVAELSSVTRVIAIGSDGMMAAVKEARHGVLAPFLSPQHVGIGSINSPMQCMMKEICAQCLQRHVDPVTGQETFVFSCSNQDQELDRVDFAHLRQRLRTNSAQEKLSSLYLRHLLTHAPPIKAHETS